MLGDCVGKTLALDVALRYWLSKLIEIPSFGFKYPCGVFLRKNGSLGKLGHRGFMMMMVTMMMINCFCGMVDQRKALSLTSSQDHYQRF